MDVFNIRLYRQFFHYLTGSLLKLIALRSAHAQYLDFHSYLL